MKVRDLVRLTGKHLDKSKVEQAFRQAAKTLASGDKDARAGRYVKRESNSGRFDEKSSDKKGQSHRKTN